MAVYVLLTRIDSSTLRTPRTFEVLERQVVDRVREECPEIRWLQNLSVSGPYDYLDIFEAPTWESALKVSLLVRTFGHAYTELWSALDWPRFKEMIRALPSRGQASPLPVDDEE